ncbi:hypothetical protein [Pseudothauera hydrothermalis]|uniref:hypothetical protein n=1 Tax=Pseudothauera hydrothermalis TaxID=2184083 RepID=UPI0013C2FAB6|nr:hypothetical protein [Pseudothauera hydrothermalis]
MMKPVPRTLCRRSMSAPIQCLPGIAAITLLCGVIPAAVAQDTVVFVPETERASVLDQTPAISGVDPASQDRPDPTIAETIILPEQARDVRQSVTWRALLNGRGPDSAIAQPRRLSAEERSALRLDLLRAVRSAYPDDSER